MRMKRFILTAALLLLITAGAGATIQHKTPVDPGPCPSGEYWCVTYPEWTETVNGVIIVHAKRTECTCAG